MLKKMGKYLRYLLGMMCSFPKVFYFHFCLRSLPVNKSRVVHYIEDELDGDALKRILSFSKFSMCVHVCIIKNYKKSKLLRESTKGISNIKFIKSNSFRALHLFSTSGVVFSYQPLPLFFTKREEQRIISVLKGTDIFANGDIVKNSVWTRQFLISDNILPLTPVAMESLKARYSMKITKKLCDENLEALCGQPLPYKSLLIYADTLKLNGITTSLLNLILVLSREDYDITLVTRNMQHENLDLVIKRIPPFVNILLRDSARVCTPLIFVRCIFIQFFGVSRLGRFLFPCRWWREEARRYLGTTQFQCAIDFVGYSVDSASFVLASQANQKLIWGHNDMMSECETRFPRLRALFSLYPSFDAFVSCSEALKNVNQSSLANPRIKFEGCRNFANLGRVVEGLKRSIVIVDQGVSWLLSHASTAGEERRVALDILVSGTVVKQPKYRFVMIGRLSPEKNYITTIQAFAKFLQQKPLSKLFIVGEGPLKSELQDLICALNVQSNIELVGRLENPAELMAQCDCFMLTSLYEGQPMVIHEARIAKMPIIMSRFSSYKDAMLPNGQILVETDEDSILAGLVAFSRGEFEPYDYDAESYNHEVLEKFQALCEGRV